MKLLDNESLERSSVVANSRMNRERGVAGVNSYEKELGFNPLRFLDDRLPHADAVSWLDLCCGRGRALIDAAESFWQRRLSHVVALHGVDLVDMFDDIPGDVDFLQLASASLHDWRPAREFDLITCVHGLHYVGDKLALVEQAASWLSKNGLFVASLDIANLRRVDGQPLGRRFTNSLRHCGLIYDSRRHLISCVGRKAVSLGFAYIGADDTAGPNYSGQEAVNSCYELPP